MFASRLILRVRSPSSTCLLSSSSKYSSLSISSKSLASQSSSSLITKKSLKSSSFSCHNKIQIRSLITLPVIETEQTRLYDFPIEISNVHPPNETPTWHWPEHVKPIYKSTLTVTVSDLKLSKRETEILLELVGARHDKKLNKIKFVSRNLPNIITNENRVFQMLDACLLNAKLLAKEFETENNTTGKGEITEKTTNTKTLPKSSSTQQQQQQETEKEQIRVRA